MHTIAILLLSSLAPAQADAGESIELVRARYALQLAAGFIPVEVEQETLVWDAKDPEAVDELNRPFNGTAYQAGKADLVVNVQATSKVKGVTPIVFAQDPSGEPVALGDLSPNAGEADAWLRLHTEGEWLFLVLADTAKTRGEVELKLVVFDTSGVGAPATLGTMLQTEGGPGQPAAAPQQGGPEPAIVDSELDPSDPTMDDGAYYEQFTIQLDAGDRMRVAALSDHYDLYAAVIPPSGDPIRAESSGLAATPALIDHIATSTGEYQLAIFGKESSAQGAYRFLVPRVLGGDVCQQLATYEVADPWALEGIEDARVASVMRSRTLLDTMAFAQTCEVSKFGIDLGASCSLPVADAAAAHAAFDPLAEQFRACNAGWEISEHPSGEEISLYAVLDGRTRSLAISHEALAGWSVRASTAKGE
jgi:hypothetical protein